MEINPEGKKYWDLDHKEVNRMNEYRWFQHQLRVRYQETDQMGVVYHANYLNWFELGRTEMIRALGYPYRTIEAQGFLLPVIEVEMKFKQPARYDEEITIYTRVASYSSIRIEFICEIRRVNENDLGAEANELNLNPAPRGELLVSGLTRHVWVNTSWKPVRLEKEAPELFQLLSQSVH
jgi:acyl-CoA thioester hydrolase